jgi:RAD51-like protein 2
MREVSTLPLSRSIVNLLIKSGFRFVTDFKGLKPLDLSQELGCTPAVALQILQSVELSVLDSKSVEQLNLTAKDLFEKSGVHRPIITFCKTMDVMLGGGVAIGQITEFCGVPGIGKTQLGIQLALNVQIPEIFNGNVI